jgi:hypothetical protein
MSLLRKATTERLGAPISRLAFPSKNRLRFAITNDTDCYLQLVPREEREHE